MDTFNGLDVLVAGLAVTLIFLAHEFTLRAQLAEERKGRKLTRGEQVQEAWHVAGESVERSVFPRKATRP